VSITAQLDSTATIPTVAWDAQDPANTSNFSTSLTIYDSLGNGHTLDVYFTKTAEHTFDYHAVVDGDELNPPQAGMNVEVGSGTLAFTTDGALDSVTVNTAISVDFAGATAGQAVTLDFGNPIAGGGTGLDGTTQFASPNSISSQSQDGYTSGDFAGV